MSRRILVAVSIPCVLLVAVVVLGWVNSASSSLNREFEKSSELTDKVIKGNNRR